VNELVLPAGLYEKVKAEGAAAYPHECCGILYGRDLTRNGITRRIVETLEPVNNEFDAAERYHRFLIRPETLMEAEKKAGGEGRLVIGFYHSHPDHPARPSQYDLDHAWPFYSYVIVSVAKGKAEVMTSWILDEATERFRQQEITSGEMNDE
jgi:proteasome lid subunit RPN8/RPN11